MYSGPRQLRPGIWLIARLARSARAIVRAKSSRPRVARCRLAASSDAKSRYDVEVVVSMLKTGLNTIAGDTVSLSFRIELCVSEPPNLWTLVAAASAPASMADTGSCGWKYRCAPWASSTKSGMSR